MSIQAERRLNLFEIERFAIHDGPGIRTCVFLQGCGLCCAWCANPESQTCGPHLMWNGKHCTGCGACERACPHGAVKVLDGRAVIDREKCAVCGKCAPDCPGGALSVSGFTMSCEELFSLLERDLDYYRASGGGVTFSGGEALLQIEELRPLLKRCREREISMAVETCGYVSEKQLLTAMEYMDLFLFDIKSRDAEKFRRYTGGELDRVSANFELLCGRMPEKVIARIPVIPGVNDSEQELHRSLEYICENGVSEVHLLPYHTLGIGKYEQLGRTYFFDRREPMETEKLEKWIPVGQEMGLKVSIGG